MRVVTADGRNVAVSGPPLALTGAAGTAGGTWSGAGRVRTAAGRSGRRRSVRYAEIARTNPWVRSDVDARASVASRVPLHVFRPVEQVEGQRRADRERVRQGDPGPGARLAALLVNPATRLSGRRWRRRILNDRLIHGNAFIEKVTVGGTLVELAWHPWVDVETHKSSDGLTIEAFEVPVERRDGLFLGGRLARGRTRMIDAADAIHILDVDEVSLEEGPIGVSPLASLHATHILHDAAMRFAIAYMDNGIFPSGMIELHKEASAAAAQATTELLAALHARVENAGAPIAVPGKWHQLSATPEAANLLELARWSREEVHGAYRVPSAPTGETANANRSSAETARTQFIRDVVGDDVAVLESELQAQLVAGNRRWTAAGIWVEGQLGELLRPDMVAMATVLKTQVGAPVMTSNEGRKILNLPPIDDPRADRLVLNPGTPDADVGAAGND